MAPEYKHTAGNHVHAFMYLNVPELSTVSILLCLPSSIKVITQVSDSNLRTGFFSTSTHSLSCSANTHLRLCLCLIPSVLC